MNENQKKLKELIDSHDNIVFFGGAGVSTESGIPDFRSADGLYNQKFAFPPEEILSHDFFFDRTKDFYDFYRAKMLCPDVKPNAAHYALARLEAAGKLKCVVTQNIDGLHTMAGSKRVAELHGSVMRNHCVKCGRFFSFEDMLKSEGVPKCSCGGIIKPDVVLYGEPLDDSVTLAAVKAIAQCKMLIIAGTSLTVYPAAGFIRYFRGDSLVLINRDPTPYDGEADLVIRDKVGETLGAVICEC